MTALAVAAAVAAVGLVGYRLRPAGARHDEVGARTACHLPPRVLRRVGLSTAMAAALVVAPAVAGGLLGVALLTVVSRRRTVRRAAAAHASTAVPDAIDLVSIGLGAGLTPQQALARAGPWWPEPLQPALAEVWARVDAGERFGDAIDALPTLGGAALQPLASALASAARDGVPVGVTLTVLAQDARTTRRQQAEAAARRLPVRLAVPLVCCILPAFGLLTVAPLLLGSLRSLTSP